MMWFETYEISESGIVPLLSYNNDKFQRNWFFSSFHFFHPLQITWIEVRKSPMILTDDSQQSPASKYLLEKKNENKRLILKIRHISLWTELGQNRVIEKEMRDFETWSSAIIDHMEEKSWKLSFLDEKIMNLGQSLTGWLCRFPKRQIFWWSCHSPRISRRKWTEEETSTEMKKFAPYWFTWKRWNDQD